MEKDLRESNSKACVTIFTDGSASDGNVIDAMKPLIGLPVWIVIRLCTDDDTVCEYWDNVDQQLELEMDVLDDYISEAATVMQYNPWLNYGQPLHLLRESGCRIKAFDHLDEKKLSLNEIHSILPLILSCKLKDITHPELDLGKFKDDVASKLATVSTIFNPKTRKMSPW